MNVRLVLSRQAIIFYRSFELRKSKLKSWHRPGRFLCQSKLQLACVWYPEASWLIPDSSHPALPLGRLNHLSKSLFIFYCLDVNKFVIYLNSLCHNSKAEENIPVWGLISSFIRPIKNFPWNIWTLFLCFPPICRSGTPNFTHENLICWKRIC